MQILRENSPVIQQYPDSSEREQALCFCDARNKARSIPERKLSSFHEASSSDLNLTTECQFPFVRRCPYQSVSRKRVLA